MATRPVNVEYDASNLSCYVYVAIVFIYDTSADQPRERRIEAVAYPTQLKAMMAYAAYGDWKQAKPGGTWFIDLRADNPWKGYKLELHQMVLL